MQVNVEIMFNTEGNFVTMFIDKNGETQYQATDFSQLDDIASHQVWNLMTKTITQRKYNRCGIIADSIYDMLSFVKEELNHTPDISVICHKPEITITFFKE